MNVIKCWLCSLAILLLMPGCSEGIAQRRTLVLTDLADPGQDETSRFEQALQRLATPGIDTLRIPPGTYPILGTARTGTDAVSAHLTLQNLENKTIEATGAVLVFGQGHRGGLLLRALRNLTIRGLALDWQRDPFIQGTITAINPVTRTLELQPTHRRPLPDVAEWGSAVTWATLHQPDGSRYPDPRQAVLAVEAVTLAGARVQVRLRNAQDFARNGLRTGQMLVVVGRFRSAHALTVQDTDGLTLDGIEVRSSPSMGILVQARNRNFTLVNSRIAPTENRAISTNADGLHIIEPMGRFRIERTLFDSLQDDAIVVSRRGLYGQYEGGRACITLERADGSVVFQEGGQAMILLPETGALLSATLRQLQVAGRGQPPVLCLTQPLSNVRSGEVVAFPVADPTAQVTIADNTLSNIRPRGIRIHFPNVQVTGNQLRRTTGPSILMGILQYQRRNAAGRSDTPPEPIQYPAHDVTISGNTFEGFANPASGGWQRLLSGQALSFITIQRGPVTGVVRNVTIADNRFGSNRGFMRYGVEAEAVDTLHLVRNQGLCRTETCTRAEEIGIRLVQTRNVSISER
jgi:hypothetical protein